MIMLTSTFSFPFISLSVSSLPIYSSHFFCPCTPLPPHPPYFIHSLNDLEQFIKLTSGGLYVSVEEGDYDGLVSVMDHLMRVKDRQPAIDHMFEPLKETAELLTTYGQKLPDAVHQQLQVCVLPRTVKMNLFIPYLACRIKAI